MKLVESLTLLEGVCGYIFLITFADNSLQTKCYSEELLKSKQQLCPLLIQCNFSENPNAICSQARAEWQKRDEYRKAT